MARSADFRRLIANYANDSFADLVQSPQESEWEREVALYTVANALRWKEFAYVEPVDGQDSAKKSDLPQNRRPKKQSRHK